MVPRVWPDSTIVCVGSGPSLTAADVILARTAGAKILAVNSAYQLAKDADALFAGDVKWWGWHPDATLHPGLKFALPPVSHPDITTLDWSTGIGLDLDPSRVRGGGQSGYAAINLAFHLGGGTIVLLGYDCAPGPEGTHHFHGDHPDGSHLHYEYRRSVYQTILGPLERLGVRLVNASRRTAIPAIPRVALEDVLPRVTCYQ